MEFRRTAGHPVRYGSVIQLHHVDSSKFLTQSKDRAWRNRLAMELSLVQDGNQARAALAVLPSLMMDADSRGMAAVNPKP